MVTAARRAGSLQGPCDPSPRRSQEEAFAEVVDQRTGRRLPLLHALAEFRRLLIGFATQHGKPNLYHETVTFACLLLVYERMARNPAITEWERFARENSDLLSWRHGPFFQFYGANVLTDRLARFCFVPPESAAGRSR